METYKAACDYNAVDVSVGLLKAFVAGIERELEEYKVRKVVTTKHNAKDQEKSILKELI